MLAVNLVHRSTRLLAVTPEGEAFYRRIMPLLRELGNAGDTVQHHGKPAGHLRVSLPSEIGRLILRQLVTDFMPKYPEISFDISTTDRAVDVVRENYDVAYRVGGVAPAGLTGRTLTHLDMTIVVSPAFVRRHGRPRTISQLEGVPFVRYAVEGRPYPIRFSDGRRVLPNGGLDLDSATAIRDAALNGAGAAYLIRRIVEDDIGCGALIELFPYVELETAPLQAFHPYGRSASFRLQLFTDFVASVVKANRQAPANSQT